MAQLFFNNARGLLAESLSTGNTLIKVKNHENIPASLTTGDYFLLTLFRDTTRYGENLEVVKVTAVTAGVDGQLNLTVVRGYEYPAAIHTAGARLEARLTAQSLRDLLSEAKSFTQEELSSLVDAAPGTLDTLNELAAALGDDPNFATTVTNALATKLDSSAYTAADVLAKLLTVDGAGSGVNADLLQGDSPVYFLARANHTGTQPLSTISDAGTAAASDITTSPTDTTAGRALAVRSGGILSVSRDITDSVLPAEGFKSLGRGIYGVDRPTTDGVQNTPSFLEGSEYHVAIPLNLTNANSLINSLFTLSPTSQEIRWGINTAGDATGNYATVLSMFHSGNAVSAVSVSGGLPSGGLFERGSNSFGVYQKTADRQMMCSTMKGFSVDMTTAIGNAFRSGALTIDLPKSFADINDMHLSVEIETGSGAALSSWVGRTRLVSTNQVEVYLLASQSIASVSLDLNITVHGGW